MKILVIGYGSIGKRHAKNLIDLGCQVVLLRHSNNNPNKDGYREYYSIKEAIEAEGALDGAVVCSPTAKHLDDVAILVERNIPFLLEKPPAHDLAAAFEMKKIIDKFVKYDIAYNLRYYSLLSFMKDFLPKLGGIYSVRAHVGSYLPNWRKNVDYRETISAKSELGGGVHIELVHEIDYLLWFFGLPRRVFASINKISALEISSDDLSLAIFDYGGRMMVELHMDYLSHKPLRGLQVIAENGTLEADLNEASIQYYEKTKGSADEVFKLPEGPRFAETYIDEIRNFIGIIRGEGKPLVDIDSAVNVMRVVDAMERSSKEEKWISLN